MRTLKESRGFRANISAMIHIYLSNVIARRTAAVTLSAALLLLRILTRRRTRGAEYGTPT
jgi:hypothetical protein